MEISKYIDMMLVYLSQYGLKVIAAILIFFIGKWAIKKLTALSKSLLIKAKVDDTLVEFADSIMYFSLLVVVVLSSLNALGIDTTSFLAILGAASLAVGLALKDSLSNIGSAVLIIVFRPFKVGDFIDAGGASGTVEDINLFSTTISPADNRTITVPNSAITKSNITNYSKKSTRRLSHTFGIGYDDDLKLAKEILMQIMLDDKRILREPAPFVAVSELADSSINLIFRAWTKTEDYWSVYYDSLETVKLTFDEKGISIPYPQLDVHTQR
ncbi:hypothetical protein M947_08000 [Sulfurimonas hongkongensis]|uniref:Mechanosensitive ion channel protein MscS n=1 Tax=Sulfurimonas hongkongensis TaxID=1172190 RepID=T0KPQ0_9BACT|nr:mechanosensitive ion channel domain-containing protein [Sulfurimonas hongkongensis]EQB39094.1 hypothetical protein M947_08000 [Sulfurimonas hongkongensis]